MYTARDIRETRIYKVAFAEGFQQGITIGIALVVSRKTGVKVQVAELATLLGEDVESIRQTILKWAPDCLDPPQISA